MRSRFILIGLLALSATSRADILWQCNPACAATPLAPMQYIRIGTMEGPWPTMLAVFHRPAVAAAGWYLEYRTASSAPDGWSAPVVGVDAQGAPAAVRSPLPPPPPAETDPGDLAAALSALATRIETERQRRVSTVVGTTEEQIWRISRQSQLQAAVAADTATNAERSELADLLVAATRVDALRRYARTPQSPPMWGAVAGTDAALYAWVEGHLTDVAAISTLNPASPPVAAPQWPQTQ